MIQVVKTVLGKPATYTKVGSCYTLSNTYKLSQCGIKLMALDCSRPSCITFVDKNIEMSETSIRETAWLTQRSKVRYHLGDVITVRKSVYPKYGCI